MLYSLPVERCRCAEANETDKFKRVPPRALSARGGWGLTCDAGAGAAAGAGAGAAPGAAAWAESGGMAWEERLRGGGLGEARPGWGCGGPTGEGA